MGQPVDLVLADRIAGEARRELGVQPPRPPLGRAGPVVADVEDEALGRERGLLDARRRLDGGLHADELGLLVLAELAQERRLEPQHGRVQGRLGLVMLRARMSAIMARPSE